MRHILFLWILFCGLIHGAIPQQIIENIESVLQEKERPIIAIGGCPGVGKSTFATLLLQELSKKNIRSVILGFDDFGKTQEERKELSHELDIRRIRWRDLYAVLEEIKLGNKKIKIPKINQLTKARGEALLDLEEIDLIIFEGMYALSYTDEINLGSYVDLGIYMETTTENICQWKWEREQKKAISRTIGQFETHMALIFEDFIRLVYPTRQNADWIVFANHQHEFTIIP